ncbi:hypothetical protein CARUB_v10015138mg [Capsella rubella]|uniref:Bidirectional sugar transporter SWEET n=1 Tax=Capsella rubella TaxID=81985 RepID=R0G8P3_9BRAS|nr:bidirectional sugar transporter SWEET6 [Capsella rubella]EOA31901.1 hypothetical protein CARUB_v10015138mg [Capsella rubella]
MAPSELNLLRQIVGIIGNIIALGLFLSPTPTFVGIVKKRSVEAFSPMPYLAALMNYLVRFIYALPMVHPNSALLALLSGIGIVINVTFLVIFFMFCRCQRKRLVITAILAAELAFVAVLTTTALTLQHSTSERTLSVGIASCIFNTLMYVSPLSVMKMVIETKSVEFMPFCLSLANLLNASVWTAYGFLPWDPYMAIPNGIGCPLGLVQLILYGVYYKSTKQMMSERQQALTSA